MGGGRWTSDSYETYAKTTSYRSASREKVFSSVVKASLDPKNVVLRESCDSAESPEAVPIILALDVTGSMGEYAELIAKEELPRLMGGILQERPMADPHMMFMAVDDVHTSSEGPLQMSQFEADIRILEQLRDVKLIGGGGANDSESYDLAWYAAAHKTTTDNFKKRGKRGFLFTFGDESAPTERLTAGDLQRVFGSGQHQPCTPAEALSAAQEKYHVFHVIIEQGSYCRSSHGRQRARDSWTQLLRNNVLFLKDACDLSEVVIATMRITNGEDMSEIIRASSKPEALRYAFANSME